MKENIRFDKSEELQMLNGKAPLLLFIALLALVALILFPSPQSKNANKIEIGMAKAKVLAYQIYQIHEQKQSKRGPASVQNTSIGNMGQDPWGRPFRYRIISDLNSGTKKLVVWSVGANGQVESPELENDKIEIKQVAYLGDDFGFEINLRH